MPIEDRMTDTRPEVPIEDAIAYQQARIKDRASKGIPSVTDEAILASLLDFQRIQKAERPEPVAWAILNNGKFVGNWYYTEAEAEDEKDRLDSVYGISERRKIAPLYGPELLDAYDRMAAGSNYVANKEINPTRIEFANGRVVSVVGDGYLEVSK